MHDHHQLGINSKNFKSFFLTLFLKEVKSFEEKWKLTSEEQLGS